MHCAVNLDSSARNSLTSIDSGLDRAAALGEVVELYAHDPGRTVPVEVIEHVLAGARDRGLVFVTYADFAASGGTGPGLALSFDDDSVASWTDLRPMFHDYGARITFFVGRFASMTELDHQGLRQLADDGHDLAAHSVHHYRAPAYVEDHGVAAYLADEVVPSIEVMRDAGYPITAFAYPFGARTSELDDAILGHVPIVRSVAFTYGAPAVSPCPH